MKSHGSGVSVLEVVAPQNFIEPLLATTLGPIPSLRPLFEVFKDGGCWKTAVTASQLFLGGSGGILPFIAIQRKKNTLPIEIDTKRPSYIVQGPQIPLKASQ